MKTHLGNESIVWLLLDAFISAYFSDSYENSPDFFLTVFS